MWYAKRSMFYVMLVVALLITATTYAANDLHLLPKPQVFTSMRGSFQSSIVKLIDQRNSATSTIYTRRLGLSISDNAKSTLTVSIVPQLKGVTHNMDEAYHIIVSKKSVKIEATTSTGVLRAFQTLLQLSKRVLDETQIPCCDILDWPAFKIRGFMQDVGRTYISTAELKHEIDVLSQFKINVFHWHLTENQAWRLESRIYPQLNDTANVTRDKGKFYTLREAAMMVDYCKERGMLLIPEIDMPGHSEAFVRTFKCDMQSEQGMKILKNLIDEVCMTFDVPYLHIGTDEVKFTNPDFVPQMVAYVRSKGKKVISWNPGYHYKVGEIDMTQLWSYRGKPIDGIPAIDSRFHYLNHFDTFADIVGIYTSKIYAKDASDDGLLGGIMAVWTDRKLPSERDIIQQNSFYPYMMAFAERSWMGGGSQYFDKNGTMMPTAGSKEFNEYVDFENRMLWYKHHTLHSEPFPYVKQTNVVWRITDAFPNGGDLSKVFPPETEETKASYKYGDSIYNTKDAIGAGIYLRHTWGTLIPGFYRNPQPNHTAYAFTYVYAPHDMPVGLLAEFQNYSRSEPDLPPAQGRWDYKGSRIWINDKEVMPPHWNDTTTVKNQESVLGNENFTARPPITINLKKGWNKVMLKLPVGQFSIPQLRLQKWMFATVFVTINEDFSVDNLVYSPDKKK